MFEINLVPDVKAKMLKTQRIRNLIVIASIGVVAICGVVLVVLGGIKAGQDITMSSQDDRLEELSAKINSFSDLQNLLTIQKQLNGLDEISTNKMLFSRIFSIVGTLLPTNGDEISLSELEVDMESGVISFSAQADAKTEPFIDYRVLEAFKKSMPFMRYDFGKYVDADGNEIPDVCIVETDEAGNVFSENGKLYGKWASSVKGCSFGAEDEEEDEVELISETDVQDAVLAGDFVTIWRTPQFEVWYDENGDGEMTGDGVISGVEHFESQCITYRHENDKWVTENQCMLVPEEVVIGEDSSNAIGADGTLVLRFSAIIGFNREVFSAKNKHMITIAPTGRTNVTDSFLQLEGMFKKEASDCAEGDSFCDNAANEGEEE